jgi:mono/diheme cytochrome c family protein
MRGFLSGIVVAILLAVVVLCVALTGHMNFRADEQPGAVETHLAMKAVDASTERNAPTISNPVQATDENLRAAAGVYRDNCAGCHGDPATPQRPFGQSFYPPAPQFANDAPDMPENQNYYLIQHGVRWTGMPAWKATLTDVQIWQLVTLLSHFDKLTPEIKQEFKKPITFTQQ